MLPDRASQRRFLAILITLSLVRGIVYTAFVPLWQAPDEPAHFEYVALIAEQHRLPDERAVSPQLRREIVAAMPEQNWNRFMDWKVDGGDVLSGSRPKIPGPTELRHPPLYYLLGAFFLWPLRQQEIPLQVYALRLYSVLLGTLTLGVIYATARELFPRRWHLQVAVPLLLLFIPAHTFLSATVNNDRLAELILSAQFFLWTRVFRQGLTWQRALGIVTLLGLGLWTKSTTVVGIPLAGIALVIHSWPKIAPLFQRSLWGRLAIPVAGAVLLILIGVLFIDPCNAQGWNKTGIWSSQDDAFVYEGEQAIRVPGTASVYQNLLPSTWEGLTAKQARLSAWVRAREGKRKGFLRISDSNQDHLKQFIVGPGWRLQVLETVIPTDTQTLSAYLGGNDPQGELYFDAVQLAEASPSTGLAPRDSRNLLVNGSGEVSQWDLKPSAYRFLREVLYLDFDTWFFGSFFDWRRYVAFRDQYWTEFWVLLTNFWASMGVRQVNPSRIWQWALLCLGLVNVGGVVLWIRRERHGQGDMEIWQKRVVWFYAVAAALSVATAVARMHPLPATYYPHGRYIYIGILPTVTLMVLGWREWAMVRLKVADTTWLLAAGVIVGCLFDAMMLFDYAIPYFYGPT